MSEMELDAAYSNAPHIPGAEDYPARWRSAAAAFRAGLGARAREGLASGPAPRQRFDLFLPEGPPRGLFVFVHGGYWRSFGREDWSHLAAGAVARGWAVAVPGYTLAPEARIPAITREIAAAVSAACREVPGGALVLAGHSAGGHLVARMACPDVALPAEVAGRLARVIPISPLADLRPLLRISINADLGLDAAEAEAESPALHRPRPGVAVHVWVGADERPAFVAQARLLGESWGAPVTLDEGRHHFDVIESLAAPQGALTETALGGL